MQNSHSKILLAASVLALGAGVACYVWLQAHDHSALKAGSEIEAQAARPLPDFTLIDQAGKPFGKERLIGHWTFLFFGYTHCPDVCPNTLATLNQVVRNVDKEPGAERPQVLFVSVDPQRDSPARLAEYVQYFNAGFIGATGDAHLLEQLAGSLGIAYARRPPSGSDPSDYVVDHGASVLLIGPYASLRAVFSPPLAPRAIAADFLTLSKPS